MFLGVDTSANHTGVVVLHPSGSLAWCRTVIPEAACTGPARLLFIRNTLETILGNGRFCVSAREAYSHGSTHRAFLLGEVGGLATVAMYVRSQTYIECAPSALKKFAASDARAEKGDMCQAVRSRWGFDTTDDNLADAFALAQVAYAFANPADCTRPQLEVLATIRKSTLGEKKTVRRAALRNKHSI